MTSVLPLRSGWELRGPAVGAAILVLGLGCGTTGPSSPTPAPIGAAAPVPIGGPALAASAAATHNGSIARAFPSVGPHVMSPADLDRLLADAWRDAHVVPAPDADDSEYLRRVTLDVAGRIPTLAETERFLADRAANKRERLVDGLLASVAYPEHFADLYMDLFIGQQFRKPNLEKRLDPRAYFVAAFRDNKRFDQIARDLLTFSGEMQPGGPGVFLASHLKGGGPEMAASVAARLFLGVQIQCAQCHDHPYDARYKQEDFYGLVAYFARTKQKEEKVAGPGASTSPVTLPPAVDEKATTWADKHAGMTPTATAPMAVSPPPETKSDAKKSDVKMTEPAVAPDAPMPGRDVTTGADNKIYSVFDKPGGNAKFKRAGATEDTVVRPRFLGRAVAPLPDEALRQTLARAIVSSDLFAKTVVDRTWAQLFGRGIMEPWDDLGGEHDPRHPVLLDRLAADFQTSGYDFKHLVRVILLSRAYGLTSRATVAVPSLTPASGVGSASSSALASVPVPSEPRATSEPSPANTNPAAGAAASGSASTAPAASVAPPPEDPTAVFARAAVRRLTPEQLFQSLLVATGAEHVEGKGPEDIAKKIERAMKEYQFVFGDDEMAEINTFNGNIPQALLLFNGEIVNQGAKGRSGGTLAAILDANPDPTIRLRKMFLVAYARPPTETEAARLLPALAAPKAGRAPYEDVFFALLTSTEMLTVH